MDLIKHRYRAVQDGDCFRVARFNFVQDGARLPRLPDGSCAPDVWSECQEWRVSDGGLVRYGDELSARRVASKLSIEAARQQMVSALRALNDTVLQNIRTGHSPIGRVLWTQRVDGEQ